MFSSIQIIGIVVCVVAAIAIAFLVARLDSAIVATPEAEEDPLHAADSTTSVATQRPPMPAGGKKLSRSQRKNGVR